VSILARCLECNRRLQDLNHDLERIVAALRAPAPISAHRPARSFGHLQWAAIAAAVMVAFVCGRFSGTAASASNDRGDPGGRRNRNGRSG
jgi:hypothetical protein